MLHFTRLLHSSINLSVPLKAVENPVLLTSPECILSLQLKSSENLARLGAKVTVVPVKTIPSIMCVCHQLTLFNPLLSVKKLQPHPKQMCGETKLVLLEQFWFNSPGSRRQKEEYLPQSSHGTQIIKNEEMGRVPQLHPSEHRSQWKKSFVLWEWCW